MKNKENIWTKEISVKCSCGCGVLELSQWKDDGMSFISYYVRAFDSSQETVWDKFKERIKILWNVVILGKKHYFYDVVIDDNKTLDELKKFVSEMGKINENS